VSADARNRKTPCGDFLEIVLKKARSGDFGNPILDSFEQL
jgi:hypothetical protein